MSDIVALYALVAKTQTDNRRLEARNAELVDLAVKAAESLEYRRLAMVDAEAEIKRLHIARLTDAGTHAREHRTAEHHIQSLRDDCAELRRCLDAATGAEP